MSSQRTVAIAGAGDVAKYVAEQLLQRRNRVVVLSREVSFASVIFLLLLGVITELAVSEKRMVRQTWRGAAHDGLQRRKPYRSAC